MSTQIIHRHTSSTIPGTMSAIEKIIVRRAHPRRIAIDLAVAPWVVYFLWFQDAWRAASLVVIFGFLGLASVWRTDPDELARTTLGKLALLHLHPMNMALQLLAVGPLIGGIWTHSSEFVLLGISLLGAGHTFGWEAVDARFAYGD